MFRDSQLGLVMQGRTQRPGSPRERGINVISSSARGIGAPKGMPAPIVKKLEEAFFKANNEPEFIKEARELELPLYYLDSKAYSEYLRSLDTSYRVLWAKQPWVK